MTCELRPRPITATSAAVVVFLTSALAAPLLSAEPAERHYDSNGLSYDAIDAEPSLGKIVAYNPGYALAIVRLDPDPGVEPGLEVEPGLRIALRRDGVIVAFGYVESLENAALASLHLVAHNPSGPAITRPAVGDEMIRIPHPYFR